MKLSSPKSLKLRKPSRTQRKPKLRIVSRRSVSTRHTSKAISTPTSNGIVVGTTYLQTLLPSGWQSVYTPQRAGRFWGLPISCAECGARPPAEVIYGSQRWRWVAIHERMAHGKNGNSNGHKPGKVIEGKVASPKALPEA